MNENPIGLSNRVAFIGCAGVPNRYGGFEAFVEYCGPEIASKVEEVFVTCDAGLYEDVSTIYKGLHRIFIKTPANGWQSIFHDLFAFLKVFKRSTHIVVLGVSGGVWFPFFRILCDISRKKLIVNVDGVEWRRDKFSFIKRCVIWIFDRLAQIFSHVVIYDNVGLKNFIIKGSRGKSVFIAYSGDHVIRKTEEISARRGGLTICRIEPENNIEMLILGALQAGLKNYKIVGNWNSSKYGINIRNKYSAYPNLSLLDPIYDPMELAKMREECAVYLHGHSVGGTNPSLVEMLFYDCRIICFDVIFNRETAKDAAEYFQDIDSLALEINSTEKNIKNRSMLREMYKSRFIANEYLKIFQ